MKPQTIIFYGSSGAGKGTQAKLLKKYIEEKDTTRKVLYIETGALLREFVKEDNFTSSLTDGMLEEGKLLPSFIPIWVWTDFLIKNYTGNEHLVWDGLARRLHEAVVVDSAIEFYKRENLKIIVLNISKEESTARLRARGRSDDIDEEDIKNRLSWYETEVVPTINFFRENEKYTIIDINGEQSIEEVQSEIREKLNI